MGRGIVHRKVQTNRARALGANDHQSAGIGALALSSAHRDNPEHVARMLNPPKPAVVELVSIPRDAFDELVARVLALETAKLDAQKFPALAPSLEHEQTYEPSAQ